MKKSNPIGAVTAFGLRDGLSVIEFEERMPKLRKRDRQYILRARYALASAGIPGDASLEHNIIEAALLKLAGLLSYHGEGE